MTWGLIGRVAVLLGWQQVGTAFNPNMEALNKKAVKALSGMIMRALSQAAGFSGDAGGIGDGCQLQ